MPYDRPSLKELIERTLSDVVSRLPDADVLRRSDADVYARVIAGAAHGLYGFADWISRQVIYDTADDEILERWAAIWGVTRKLASNAGGTVYITGSNGSVVPSGAVFVSYDGQRYYVVVDVAVSGVAAAAQVLAVDAGAAGNRVSGHTLTMQSPVAGVSSTAIAGAMTGGADIESYDALRDRFFNVLRNRPQGGSKSDYEQWALEVPGVTRAFVLPLAGGAGTVSVWVMMDGTYVDGIPLAGDVAAVAEHIDSVRPVTAAVTVAAPVASPVNFVIAGLWPNTPFVRDAVVAELSALIKRDAVPGGTLLISHIMEAISTAGGEFDHSLSTPPGNVVNAVGEISVMGTVSFI